MKFEIVTKENKVLLDDDLGILLDNVKINYIQKVMFHADNSEDDYEKVVINLETPLEFCIEEVHIKGHTFAFNRIMPKTNTTCL